jgi:hypothetical protein
VSPELRGKIDAIEAKYAVPKAKPKPAKLVAEEGKVVANAEVQVSPRDPNWREGPRPGFVTINTEVAERQWFADRAAAQAEAAHRAMLDPVGLGHWGPRR